MFKKLNQYLITRYPLLWNTRVAVFLPLALIIHLLFYLGGFGQNIPINELWQRSHFSTGIVVTFSVLVSLLFIIIWLVFYLRNNPFKTFYNLSKAYLFGEFLIIFVVFFVSATFFLSYKQGIYDGVKATTNDVELSKEANLVNLSMHFIAFNMQDFNINSSCDSVKSWGNYEPTPDTYSPGQRYTKQAPRPPSETIEESYLYYCDQLITFYGEEKLVSRFELGRIANKWLVENKRDSVENLLKSLVILCEKYGITYSFNTKEQVLECFNDEYFTVRQILSSGHAQSYNGTPYINIHELGNSIEKIDEVRKGFWDLKTLWVWLYYSIVVSIVLFTYRITRRKNWFIALVGTGIWSILIGLFVAIFRPDQAGVYFLIVFLFILFVVYTLVQVRLQQNKMIAGVTLNWFVWLLPGMLPYAWGYMLDYTRIECDYSYNYDCEQTPFHDWLNANWMLMNGGNMVLIVVVIMLFVIPLARRWQANPEE